MAINELLSTMSGVLDIRDVFEHVSAVARKVIPRDALSLPPLTEDKNNVDVYAVTGSKSEFPQTVPLPDHHRPLVTSAWDYLTYEDIQRTWSSPNSKTCGAR